MSVQGGWRCKRCGAEYDIAKRGHPLESAGHYIWPWQVIRVSLREDDETGGITERSQLTCPCGSQDLEPLPF